MQGNVQSIAALRDLRLAALELSKSYGELSFDLKTEVSRALEWINEIAPAYWQQQLVMAERQLAEAQDYLAAMLATYGGKDKPPATEAKKRVTSLKRRVVLCNKKLLEVKKWRAEIERASNLMVSTSSNLQQCSESTLPVAAARLESWIKALEMYAETPE